MENATEPTPPAGKRQQPRGVVSQAVHLTLSPVYKTWLEEHSADLPGGMSELVRRLIDRERLPGRGL